MKAFVEMTTLRMGRTRAVYHCNKRVVNCGDKGKTKEKGFGPGVVPVGTLLGNIWNTNGR